MNDLYDPRRPTVTTADLVNALHDIPVRKGGILPLTEYGDGSARWDWSAGIPGSIADAFTAPARAYRGEIPDDQMIPEGLNFAGSVALGSAAVPKPSVKSPGWIRAYRGRSEPGEAFPSYGGNEVFASTNPRVAEKYTDLNGVVANIPGFEDLTPHIYPVDMKFRNPMVVDNVKPTHWYEITHAGREYTTGDLAHLARNQGHDGLLVNNVMDGANIPATTAVALKRGTVFSPTTGELLFSNPTESAAPGTLLSSASHLDMSPEARMARAREMGFLHPQHAGPNAPLIPEAFYHQTHVANVPSIMENGFDLYRIGARKSDEQMPNGVFLKPGSNDIGVGGTGEHAAQVPVWARIQQPHIFKDRSELDAFLRKDPEYSHAADELALYDREQSAKFDKLFYGDWGPRGSPQAAERNAALDAHFAETDAGIATRAAAARDIATRMLQNGGYDAMHVWNDTGGTFGKNSVRTTVVFDPKNLRSPDAAFDPAKSSSANLLAANPETSAAPGLAVSAAAREQPDLTELLNRYGLAGLLAGGAASGNDLYR